MGAPPPAAPGGVEARYEEVLLFVVAAWRDPAPFGAALWGRVAAAAEEEVRVCFAVDVTVALLKVARYSLW